MPKNDDDEEDIGESKPARLTALFDELYGTVLFLAMSNSVEPHRFRQFFKQENQLLLRMSRSYGVVWNSLAAAAC